MSNKKVIGVYIKEEVLEDITFLARFSPLSRNGLISEMLEFASDCYTQDFEMKKKLKAEFDKSLPDISVKSGSEALASSGF